MLAATERPTPIPTGDAEDDCATQVWKGAPILDGGAGTAPAWASTAPDAVAQGVAPLPSEPPARDTRVDRPRVFEENAPPESRVVLVPARRRPWWTRFFEAFADAFGSPPLWKRLPSIPAQRSLDATRVSPGAVPNGEHGEFMLFALLRAPHVYQQAAIHLVYRALDARRAGGTAYVDFVVHFALSRMRPDRDGRISMQRVQDCLCHLGHAGAIAPTLRRLEEQGTVELVLKKSDDPMAAILRSDITHVVLRVRA